MPESSVEGSSGTFSTANALDIDKIIASGIRSLFQPIIDLTKGEPLGYECFSRGPDGHLLEPPARLFHEARCCNLLPMLEVTCRELAIRRFTRRRLHGKLFLHCHPSAFLDPEYPRGQTRSFLDNTSLSPDQIVIELTAQHFQTDFGALREALDHYRTMGFQTAIAGLGSSQDGLRLWSEIQPDFVKLDQHFTRDIHLSPVKQAFVRSLVQLCQELQTQLIMTGVETDAEWHQLQTMGVTFQQGFLFAAPAPHHTPMELPSSAAFFDRRTRERRRCGDLANWVEPTQPDTTVAALWHRFDQDRSVLAIPIADQGMPLGLMHRGQLCELLARPNGHQQYAHQAVSECLNSEVLTVRDDTALTELSEQLNNVPDVTSRDHFIVLNSQGHYLGIGKTAEALHQLTETRLQVARHANPLTHLPGNVPTNEHLERMVQRGQPFHVAYVDMDAFKPFNDTYGYQLGDKLIIVLAGLMQSQFHERCYFIGHIGGDDFMVITSAQSPSSQLRLLQQRFTNQVHELMRHEDNPEGPYQALDRDGNRRLFILPRISIGLVSVPSAPFPANRDALADSLTRVKHAAKQCQGHGIATLTWSV